MKSHGANQGFEGIRRRLEGESSSMGTATGVQQAAESETNRRRTMGQQLIDEVRGAF